MITLRRAEERHHDRRRKREAWLTFYPRHRADPLAGGFGALEVLDEVRLPPGADAPDHPHRDAEIVTYVRQGALACQDSTGGSAIVQAGEFQHLTTGRGMRHRETNASLTDWAQVFQISLCPAQANLEPGHQQKRFSAAERRGWLCVVGSPDGRKGSLRIHQDALMYSALLDPGKHVVHELLPGRSAWLHLVQGQATLGDLVLTTGDGVGVRAERAVSLTAQAETEILLLDLREPLPRGTTSGSTPGRRSTRLPSQSDKSTSSLPERSQVSTFPWKLPLQALAVVAGPLFILCPPSGRARRTSKCRRESMLVNLPFSASDDEIRSLFSEHGAVEAVNVPFVRRQGGPGELANVEENLCW